MYSLRELQIEMEQAIVAPQAGVVPPRLVNDHFSIRERLNVYRNNFALGHHEALTAVYPAVRRLVGSEFFETLAAAYRQYDPRTSANVHDYGMMLAEFLKDFPPVKTLSYLSDVARLEWAYHEVFHAGTNAESNVVWDALADNAVLMPHPAVRWLESPYPVLEIWRQNCREQDEPGKIDLEVGGDRLLIYHTDLDIEIARLGITEYSLITALAKGEVVSDVFFAYAEQIDVASIMAFCLTRQIFIGIKEREKNS